MSTPELSPDDIAAAEEIGRALGRQPVTERQRAFLRDVFGPRLRTRVAERKARAGKRLAA